MNNEWWWLNGFVEQLGDLANEKSPNRAAMAHLRRGLCGPSDFTLARVGWLFRNIDDEDELDAAILAAGLFAWVKGACKQNQNANFGYAFGCGLSQEAKDQREKRFTDLLDTDREELPFKLRQAITLIARDSVGLDWGQLVKDITGWSHPDRWVQRNWARGFWSNPTEDKEEAVATSASE